MKWCWRAVALLLPAACCAADGLPVAVSTTYGRSYNEFNTAQFPVSAANGFDHRQDLLSVNVSGATEAAFTWRVRLLAARGDASGFSRKAGVKELNKIWRLSDSCFASAGKRILSWDVGYLAQPLGFFQSQVVLSDLDDKYGNSEGLPLLLLSCSLDNGGAVDVVRSDDIEHRHDSDNTNLHQTALRYSQHAGLASYSVVLRQVGGGEYGVGLTYSTTLGESLEFHLSDYTSRGGRRVLHEGVLGGVDRFWSDSPYVATRERKPSSHLLAGVTWTPDPYSSVSAELSHNDAGLSPQQWRRWAELVRFHQGPLPAGVPGAVRDVNLLWDLSTIKTAGTRQNYLYLQAQHNGADLSYSIGREFCLDDGSGVTLLSVSRRLARGLKAGLSLNFYGGGGRDEFAYLPYRRSGAAYLSAAF
jgi:hypothetical protein